MSLVDAIPQTIKQIGQIRASGAAGRGAYGRSLGDIGQLVASIPGQMRANEIGKQQDQARAQQLEMGGLELAEKKRAAAANEALESAMSQALDANGNVDPQKLTQHLAGTPAASKIPDILEHFSRMQQSSVNLQIAKGNLNDSDRDEDGAIAAAAEAAGTDADTQAGVLLTGYASQVKRGRRTQEDATAKIANLMQDVNGEGPAQPDPEKVKAAIAQMKAGSKEQRQLGASDAQKEASAADALARKEDRETVTGQRKLQNYSRQLANARDQAAYARIYQGVPAEFSNYFDAPEAWTKDSAQRAADIFLSPDQRADNTRADSAATETHRHNTRMESAADVRAEKTGTGGGGQGDAEAIADAIIRGDQPPELTGLYRMGAPVRAILAKKGYNQATALTDWRATQKHVATLNGAQQTRMGQAIDNAAHSLDVIEDLSNQWDGGKFPILNKARLAAAKQGALGPQAQQIATQLEAQISDVTSELGNVYMGGNSPTDHALTLAAKNLSADWTKDQLKSALTLARKNLQIRQNSMRNVGVAGSSPDNPYAPHEAPPAAPPAQPAIGVGLSYQDYLKSKGGK